METGLEAGKEGLTDGPVWGLRGERWPRVDHLPPLHPTLNPVGMITS